MSQVLTEKQRDALFKRLRDDPKFRELMRKDWRAAMKAVNINPQTVAKSTITNADLMPSTKSGIDVDVGFNSGWTISVVNFGKESIVVKEPVSFERRK